MKCVDCVYLIDILKHDKRAWCKATQKWGTRHQMVVSIHDKYMERDCKFFKAKVVIPDPR